MCMCSSRWKGVPNWPAQLGEVSSVRTLWEIALVLGPARCSLKLFLLGQFRHRRMKPNSIKFSWGQGLFVLYSWSIPLRFVHDEPETGCWFCWCYCLRLHACLPRSFTDIRYCFGGASKCAPGTVPSFSRSDGAFAHRVQQEKHMPSPHCFWRNYRKDMKWKTFKVNIVLLQVPLDLDQLLGFLPINSHTLHVQTNKSKPSAWMQVIPRGFRAGRSSEQTCLGFAETIIRLFDQRMLLFEKLRTVAASIFSKSDLQDHLYMFDFNLNSEDSSTVYWLYIYQCKSHIPSKKEPLPHRL